MRSWTPENLALHAASLERVIEESEIPRERLAARRRLAEVRKELGAFERHGFVRRCHAAANRIDRGLPVKGDRFGREARGEEEIVAKGVLA